jgi:preprotein translocase subunit SecD
MGRRFSSTLVAAAAALAIAGCGGDDDGGGEVTTAAAEPVEFGIYDFEQNVVTPFGTEDAASQGFATSAEAVKRVAAVPDGTALVVHDRRGASGTPQYFVLRDRPAVTAADVTSAEAETGPTGEPAVSLVLSEQGQAAFKALTAEIARRAAAEAKRDTQSGLGGLEHFAVVVDEVLFSLPTIDFQQYPNGIDGRAGIQISGDLTQQEAEELAASLAAAAPGS